MVLRYSLGFAFGAALTVALFWVMWVLVSVPVDVFEMRQATRVEFTRMRQDTEVQKKQQEKVKPDEPPPVPEVPQMNFAKGSVENNVAQLTPTVDASGAMSKMKMTAGSDRDIIPLVREVVTMGGAFGESQTPEFNARCDPEAAAIVLNAGWPIRLFGLDITRRVHFSREEFAALPENDPAVALLKRQAPGWIERIESMGWDHGGCALHDAVAASAFGSRR